MHFRTNGSRVLHDDCYLKTAIIIKTQKLKFVNEHVSN